MVGAWGGVAPGPASPRPPPIVFLTTLPPLPSPAHPIPRSLADVDNGHVLGYGAELAPDHPVRERRERGEREREGGGQFFCLGSPDRQTRTPPPPLPPSSQGYHDAAYKRRRAELAKLAASVPFDAPPPRVAYTAAEAATWAHVSDSLAGLHPALACAQFNEALPRLRFSRDAVPQLADADATLRATTGWRLRPVAGLLHPRDFLAGLAFKAFHATAYLRHGGAPDYTVEPDLCHECAHLPMLTVPEYGAMAHAVGVASLGASDADVWHLIKVGGGREGREGREERGGGGPTGWGARPSPPPPPPV